MSSLAELDVLDRLAQIESKLTAVDPALGTHMTEIHKTLLANEELIHILPADRIHVLMAGMKKYKEIQLVEVASKARTPKGKKVDAEDF